MKYFIKGVPVAQGRARSFNMGNGRIGHYDPAKSKKWKEDVAWQVKSQKPILMSGPLSVEMIFFMPRPKSLSKKVGYHTRKPDVSNLVKGIEDALNDICYHDDSQIVNLSANKCYATPEGMIGVSLEINLMED